MKSSLLIFALGFSTAVAAQTPSGSTEESSGGARSGAANNPSQVICRSVADLGTRLSRSRVCRTRSEWEAARRDTRQTIDRAQGSGLRTGGE